MSLITTCPACGTSFRVTPEQLSAHRGDVRCGECNHVFSALKQLAEVAPTLSAPGTEIPAEDDTPALEKSVIIPQALDLELDLPGSGNIEGDHPAGSSIAAGKSLPKPSIWLIVLLLLLSLAALGQSAYFMRTEIASSYPPAKPWLEQACLRLGCTVELPKQEKQLVIEDSDLQDNPEHEGVLVLVSTINNLAPVAQAYPLLELTLTDTFDKPVLRRTFAPKEYLPGDVVIAQGIAGGGETHVRLNLGVTGSKPAGYRLIVKY